MKSKEVLISIKDLKKTFHTKYEEKIVHNGINLNIYRGEVLAIVGENGAGKTVLVETIAGIRKQDSGTIEYSFGDGVDYKNEIGLQFQEEEQAQNLLTPNNLINFYKKLYGSKKVDEEELKNTLKIFGVSKYLNKPISKLSGGQKQRLNLLLAIMHNPQLVILDEFITGLDVVSVVDILEYIANLRKTRNTTIILISHQPEEIKELSDRVILLKGGVVAFEKTTKEIDKEYKGNFKEFLINNIR